MTCKECGHKLKVIDSVAGKKIVYRKRKCPECNNIYYSKEEIVTDDEVADVRLTLSTLRQPSRR